MEPPATSSSTGQRRVVDFSPAEIANLREEHALSLHAKVLHKKVGPEKLRSHLHWLWSREGKHFEGTLEVFPLENDFFQLKFSNSIDYKMALDGVPWLIDGHCISLRPWVPNFKPSAAVITNTAVWVRFPELPTEYYNILALSRIATAVGKLIKVDPITENKRKCKFARLCVELDLTSPLPSHVELDGGFLQPIEYEGLHVLCYQCGCVGHLNQDCSYLPSFHESSNESYNHPSYGPWLNVPPRRSTQELQASTAAATGTAGSRFHVLKQENITNKSERKPVSKQSTSGVKMVVEPAVCKTEQLPNIQFEESMSSRGKNIVANAQSTNDVLHLDWTQTLPKMEGPSSSRGYTKPKLLPNFYSLESSNSNSPKQSPKSTPPMCANDEFFFKGVQRATQEREINNEQVEIVEHSTQGCPMVFTTNSKISDMDIRVNISPLPSGNANEHHINFIPTGIPIVPEFSPRKILSWNCRGAGDPKVIRTIKHLCERHRPSIVLLFETRIDGADAKKVIEDLGFSSSYCVDSVGFVGGVWILWHQEQVVIEISPNESQSSSNQIFAAVKFIPEALELMDAEGWLLY